MTTSQTVPPSAKVIRLIHAALISGTTLFALVTQFFILPGGMNVGEVTPAVERLLLGVAVVLGAVALVLRGRVPRRAMDEATDRFWVRALAPAMTTWTVLNGAGLAAVVAYLLSGDVTAIAVAAIAVVFLIAMNPRSFERRR